MSHISFCFVLFSFFLLLILFFQDIPSELFNHALDKLNNEIFGQPFFFSVRLSKSCRSSLSPVNFNKLFDKGDYSIMVVFSFISSVSNVPEFTYKFCSLSLIYALKYLFLYNINKIHLAYFFYFTYTDE